MQSRLTIGRLNSRYLVARDLDPAAIAGKLDRAASALPNHLAPIFEPLADAAADGVWLFRSIALELTLNAGADADTLAATWARTLTRTLFAGLNGDTEGLVFFPDRAAYLASFLRDLADGDAWSLWYYQPFEGLKVLPVAAALRTALLADPARGRRALLMQEPWQAARVLSALGASEAARVLSDIDVPAGDGAPASVTLAEAVLAAWREAPAFGVCPDRLALGCWLMIVRHAPWSAGNGAKALARALAALRLAIVYDAGTGVTEGVRDGDLPALYRAAGAACAERLAPLLDLPLPVRQAVAGPPDRANPESGSAPRDTPFGGSFLLLPHLQAVPADESEQAPAGTTNLLRFAVLAACAGDDAAAVFLDPVWRDLFAVAPGFRLADLADWAAGLPGPAEAIGRGPLARFAAASAAVLSAFARTLPGFAASSPDYLRRNFLNVRARVTCGADLIEVELARPPLDLVLGITGMMRERLDLPWLDPRPIQLRPTERADET
ncbi:MAG: hypothetical protein ACJ8AI_25830 [Rhodopila sp.]